MLHRYIFVFIDLKVSFNLFSTHSATHSAINNIIIIIESKTSNKICDKIEEKLSRPSPVQRNFLNLNTYHYKLLN